MKMKTTDHARELAEITNCPMALEYLDLQRALVIECKKLEDCKAELRIQERAVEDLWLQLKSLRSQLPIEIRRILAVN
jgi:hypothetical protein